MLRLVSPSLVLLLLALSGCQNPSGEQGPAAAPPTVQVDRPVVRDVTEYEEFTGRTEALVTIEVRSRVTGYLKESNFLEGSDVTKGQVLFEIDRSTYEAELERTEAQVRVLDATVNRLVSESQRARLLGSSRAISQEELDRLLGAKAEAESSRASAKAAYRAAKLNLDFTRITSPINGRVSRRNCDPGNLVKADETILTTLMVTDPIHANFDIDERTVLRLRRLIREGKLKSARESNITVNLGLADDEGKFSLVGTIDFVENKLDAGTGTLRIRVKIPNKDKFLSPGMFMRMQLAVSLPEKLPLIPEIALVSDQGQKFLYIVDDKTNEVSYRPVEIGQQLGSLRVIKKGLGPSETFVLKGQQRIRRPKDGGKAKVTPQWATTASGQVAAPLVRTPPEL
jgi:RND family efflux transporter MFP subunit